MRDLGRCSFVYKWSAILPLGVCESPKGKWLNVSRSTMIYGAWRIENDPELIAAEGTIIEQLGLEKNHYLNNPPYHPQLFVLI